MIKKVSSVFAVLALCAGLFVSSTLEAKAQVYTQTSSYTITRDLTVGSTGADVTALQLFLITNGYLGFNPGYFDQQTKAAVIRFQSAHGIPATGYFGPISRGLYNKLVITVPNQNPTTLNCPSGFVAIVHQGMNTCVLPVTGSVNNSNNNNNGTLRGDEAELENFEVNEGEDADFEEGDDDAEIVEVEFDVEEGDIRLTRADFHFQYTGDTSAEHRPWEVFDRAYLLSDGDKIAEVDAGDKDVWDREDSLEYMLRFSNFSEIIRENDSAELTLAVDVQNDITGAGSRSMSWEVFVPDNGIRGIDADNNSQEIGDEDERVVIHLEDGDNSDDDDDNNDAGLTIDESNENPDSMDIDVYEDDESDWETIFAFEITAEDEEISINELPITLEFLDNGSYDDVIEDIELVVDGDEFDDVDIEDADEDRTVITFLLDNDVTIDEDDAVTVELRVVFKEADNNYDDGDEIQAYIDDSNVENIEAENEDGDSIDQDDLNGEAYGEVHTLVVND